MRQAWGSDPSPRRYGRRALLRAALGVTGAAALAACGGAVPTTPATGGGTTPTSAGGGPAATRATTATARSTAGRTATGVPAAGGSASPAAADGKFPSPLPGVPDAYDRRPPVFKAVNEVPGRGGKVSTFQILFGAPPKPRAENQYWQELERRLGVTLEPNLVPASAAQEKLAAFTAGGELPDLTHIQLNLTPDQNRVLQQGGYTDLTPHLTGDALKEYPHLAAYPDYLWENVAINKKIYGVPAPELVVQGVFFFRQDWAEKLGNPRPKSAEEFFQLMVDSARRDPDGNGQADSFGLGAQNGSFSTGIFEHMLRLPNGWRRNPDGTLTNAIETEEFKAAIALARRVWEAGGYHPDTPTMTSQQMSDALYASKIGGMNDGFASILNRRRLMRAQVPTANLVGLVPPGHDGGRGVTHKGPGFARFVAIPARAGRDRERVRELLRILNWHAAPFGSEENIFKGNGIEGVHYTVQPDGTFKEIEAGAGQVFAGPTGGPFIFFSQEPGEARAVQAMSRELTEIGIDNPVANLYSPAQASRQGQLSQLRADRLAAVITGRSPLSALDEYAREWRSRGGDEIRKEYEQALRAE